MHQSYKTNDERRWEFGWKYHRQSWKRLHPHWYYVFWSDEHNDLLAHCSGYEHVLKGRTSIQKADLSRMLYLQQYGGIYADMDYIPLINHDALLFNTMKNQTLLMQGRKEQVVGLEWGFARQTKHPIWDHCLSIASRQSDQIRTGCPIFASGPKLIGRCLKSYYKLKQQGLQHMYSYQNPDRDDGSLMILKPEIIAPIAADDFSSVCGIWRIKDNHTATNEYNHTTTTPDSLEAERWRDQWRRSLCRQQLIQNRTFAVTIYSHSWGEGLKC